MAKKKRWRFLDLDELIELRQRRTINDIFSKEGEAYFRRIERDILREVSKEKKFVIACGGGIVLNEENIKVMKQSGQIVCLSASVDTILRRTQGYSHRPLLNVGDQRKKIEALLDFRRPFYQKADFTIDTSNLSIAELVKRIIAKLKTARAKGK